MATTDDILKATLIGTMADGITWNMVHHFHVDSGTETDYDQIASDIVTQFDGAYTAIEAQLSEEVDTDELSLHEWDFTNHEFDGKALAIASCIIGDLINDQMPNSVCVVLRFPTEELRRQARKFVPGPTEGTVTDNNIGAALIAAAGTSAALLNNSFAAGGLQLTPCTFNVDPLSVRYETWSLYNTVDFFVNTGPGNQRRRQPGAGI